ncbi:MAG TPA: hypothetical protein PK668_00070 [Myxococcota bacterium]|nr:hypothetical protein [Myxococcota bacterium]HRY95773.1 hypothetical protein [Myxococcota bacterium]HSA20530.1 hypothetical protein [Myxococcota bacterium]
MFRLGWFWRILALGLALGACGEEIVPPQTYLLVGTLTSTSTPASGSWGYVRLVAAGGGLADTVLLSARCQFSGPSCDYQKNQVPEGEYSVYGMVDLDDDALASDPLPDTGDLLSPGRPLIMLGRQRMDFPDNAWNAMP